MKKIFALPPVLLAAICLSAGIACAADKKEPEMEENRASLLSILKLQNEIRKAEKKLLARIMVESAIRDSRQNWAKGARK